MSNVTETLLPGNVNVWFKSSAEPNVIFTSRTNPLV